MGMTTRDIVYISAEVVVGLMSIIGNVLVVAAIVRTRRLHTTTNVFIGNLAMADIVVGVLVAPCAALSYLGLPRHFYGCVFINSVILVFTNVSILMLLAVAVERFLAIKEPFVYQRLLTVRRSFYINLVVWVLGSILGLVPLYGWNLGPKPVTFCAFTDVISMEYMVYFQFFGLVLIPMGFMLCIYVYILLIVRKHMRQTNAIQNMFRPAHVGGSSRDTWNKDVRAAKMLALVILLFALFWLPVNILNTITLFCKNCNTPIDVLLAAIVLSHANSSINPFLYAASNTRIKNGIKSMLGLKVTSDDGSNTDFYSRQNGASRMRRSLPEQDDVGSIPATPDANSTVPAVTNNGGLFTIPLEQDGGKDVLQAKEQRQSALEVREGSPYQTIITNISHAPREAFISANGSANLQTETAPKENGSALLPSSNDIAVVNEAPLLSSSSSKPRSISEETLAPATNGQTYTSRPSAPQTFHNEAFEAPPSDAYHQLRDTPTENAHEADFPAAPNIGGKKPPRRSDEAKPSTKGSLESTCWASPSHGNINLAFVGDSDLEMPSFTNGHLVTQSPSDPGLGEGGSHGTSEGVPSQKAQISSDSVSILDTLRNGFDSGVSEDDVDMQDGPGDSLDQSVRTKVLDIHDTEKTSSGKHDTKKTSSCIHITTEPVQRQTSSESLVLEVHFSDGEVLTNDSTEHTKL